MKLTDEDVREFRDACGKDGFDITLDEARYYGLRLMRLYELLAHPLPSEINGLAVRPTDANLKASKPTTSTPP
jgi:hypothetical protein